MTSSLLNICQGLANAVNKGVAPVGGEKITCHHFIADLSDPPAVIIMPDKASFENAFERASDEWLFNLCLIVDTAKGDELAQNQLRELCDGHGPSSVRRAIADDQQLGLSDVVASVYGLKGYGGKYPWSNIPHIGAVLLTKVRIV